MERLFQRTWKALLMEGVAAITFGLVVILWPAATLSVIVALFGVYAIASGVASLVESRVNDPEARGHRWLFAVGGLLSVAAGVVAFVWPGITALALLYLIVARAIMLGIIEIVTAVRLGREIKGEGWLWLSGVASIAFGVYAFFFPGAGALAVLWLIALYAIVVGIGLTAHALRMYARVTDVNMPARQ